jgi:hypothetical protein
MGILADQAFRLLRDEWAGPGGAESLSQELYLILRSQDPLQIDSPVKITNDTGQPAVSVANNGNGTETGSVFSITQGGIGGVKFDNLFPGTPAPAPATTPTVTSIGGGGIPGQIVGGTGLIYQVRLYPNGSTPGNLVTVRQLSIAAGETIPPGTWTFVTKIGGQYFMQVPVWL